MVARASVMWSDSVREAIEDRLYRPLAALRLVLLLNLVGLNAIRFDNFDRQRLGIVVVTGLALWTGVATWAYARAAWRNWPLLFADLTIACGAIGLTLAVKGADLRATIPGFWVMTPLLAWAVHWGWRGGLIAGVAIATSDFAIRSDFSQGNYGNTFLILIAGPLVGYLSESLKGMAVERDRAQRVAASAEERARLARAVHDGVLQVLAMVQREGGARGGEFATLGLLAGEQEAALRSLIRRQDGVSEESDERHLDLAAAMATLESLAAPRVHVSSPASAVVVPTAFGEELMAVLRACLTNVERHVGRDADAWVLLEFLTTEVVVSVRDEGPGIPEGRIPEAAEEGRLGITESIMARVVELGGTWSLNTSELGTEWEFAVPVPGA